MSGEGKEMGDESVLNREMKRRSEMERRGGFMRGKREKSR
jgi:hypothetical protein